MQKKIYFFIGTTTELVRISPVIKELKKRNLTYKIISSGQNKIHTEQLKDYLGDIQIDISFSEKSSQSSLFFFIIWSVKVFFTALIRLRREFKGLNKKTCHFIIFGDPISTSIGAILAKIYGLNLVHLESGDLSFDLTEPFPEEICRNINIRLADVLFPPGDWAMSNLKKVRGITDHRINTYYNTQTEVFTWALNTKPTKKITELIKSLGKYYILIMHRQEHVFFRKNWTKGMLKFILKNSNSDLECVMFDHPLSKQIISSIQPELTQKEKKRIHTLNMLTYPEFLYLMKHAEYIASDSATNQYEAFLLGKPYLALREKVEQSEGIGENVVLSKGDKRIMQKFLSSYNAYSREKIEPQKRPSDIIVDYLEQ